MWTAVSNAMVGERRRADQQQQVNTLARLTPAIPCRMRRTLAGHPTLARISSSLPLKQSVASQVRRGLARCRRLPPPVVAAWPPACALQCWFPAGCLPDVCLLTSKLPCAACPPTLARPCRLPLPPPPTGKAPAVKAIHAGLECGIIQEKLPGLDSVSYGPTIT